MKFFLGMAAGALGMWAYQTGKFEGLMNSAGDGGTMAERMRHAAETVQGSARQAVEIARPSATEVSTRPSEPLPTTGA
jgi:hypothetical protein